MHVRASLVVLALPALASAAPRAQAQKLDFERRDYPIGAATSSVGVGDFDADGLLDVVATDPGGGRILVLLQRPGRTFVVRPFPVGSAPTRLVAAELDGSPGADIAVVHDASEPAELWILLSDGTGDFTLGDVLTLPGDVRDLVAGDVDQDGDVDLVTTHYAPQEVRILRGSGDGGFPVASVFPTAGSPTWADIGDVNGDGYVDVLFVQYGPKGTTDLLGTAGGELVEGPGIQTGVIADWIHLADIDGDGALDMTSHALIYNDGAEIWIGGNYPNFIFLSLLGNNAKAVIADLNGDGKPEHVSNAKGLETRIGLGTGYFTATQTYPNCSNAIPEVHDLDADGRGDIVLFCSAKELVSIFWGRAPLAPAVDTTDLPVVPSLVHEGDSLMIHGEGFTTLKSVKLGGIAAKDAGTSLGIFSTQVWPLYDLLDDHRLLLRPGPIPFPSAPTPLEIATEFGQTTESLAVGPPVGPAVNTLTLTSFLKDEIKLFVGAPPGQYLFLLASPSPTPTTIPGVFDLGIGAGGASLFALWGGTVSTFGWNPVLLPLIQGLNVQLYFQALSLGDGSLPFPVSPVLTKLIVS